jgi:phenylalanyl-tRNA synthetase beta chain
VRIPSFRGDLNSEVDLIEEVARLYGYQKIPATIPEIFDQPVRVSSEMRVKRLARELLTSLGLNEIITYSLLSRRVIDAAGAEAGRIVEIQNPLSYEQEVMRPSLLPGMLGATLTNINRGSKDVRLFELGNVYTEKEEKSEFGEMLRLGIVLTGQRIAQWKSDQRDVAFSDAKGILEELFSRLGVEDVSFSHCEHPSLSKESSALIGVRGTSLGYIGKVADGVVKDFDVKQEVFFAELDFDLLLGLVNLDRVYRRIPVYPSISRDISLVIGKEVSHEAICGIVNRLSRSLIKTVQPFDQYVGKQIPEGKKSITYRLEYQDPTRTLEDSHVNEIHSKICEALKSELGATIR